MPIVVVERGNDKGSSLKIEPGGRYVFGRDPSVGGLTLSDSLTSRRHFEIRSEGGSYVIRDLGSTNGTFLNDERIEEGRLTVGDKIQAGDTILSFLSDRREDSRQGLVGKTVGGYKLLERVGRGGMGTVYKANQLSLNRIVAFKVLSARLLRDEKFIERFKSEARAAGQLNHPNIVQVYDVGTDRQIHFFSMEFMDGGSLQDRIGKDGKLPWDEVLDILIQASRALIFAEKKGIVHRDVKPDNLMLTSDGQVKLADLGLARRAEQLKNSTEEGIFGTPHFISPEQAQGLEVDHRADLYSLGATAYRLLAGRTPFLGSNMQEIILQQISATPPPLREFCPDCPEDLAAVIERLMRKDPDDRYPSAAALLEDLEAIRLAHHLKAQGAGAGKGVYVAVGIALLAVASVVVFALTRGKPPPAPPPTATGTAALPPPPGTQKPEVIDNPELVAQAAFQTVQVREARLGELRKTWKSRGPEWRAVADRFEEVGRKHPDTKYGKQATARAAEIRRELADLEKAEAARLARLRGLWAGLEGRVLAALKEGRYRAAREIALSAPKLPWWPEARTVLPGAANKLETWLGSGADSLRGRFDAAWKNVLADVDRHRRDGRFPEAASRLRAFLERALGKAPGDFGREEREQAGRILGELRTEYRRRLLDELAADRLLYVQTDEAVRHHAESASRFPANPVFDLDFHAAADLFARLLDPKASGGALRSAPYRDRAARRLAHLKAVAALVDSLIRRLNDGDVATEELDFPDAITGGGDTRIELNRARHPPVTPRGIEIVKRIERAGVVGTSPEFLEWSEFSPLEIYRHVFLEGKRWTLTPAEHLALAFYLAETGTAEGLREEIDAAGPGADQADRAYLEAELAAILAWKDVLRLLDGGSPEDLEIATGNFVERHSTTDYFLLVYGYPPEEIAKRSLVPPAERDAWLARMLQPLEPE